MGTGDKATSVNFQHARTTPRPHQQKILQACKKKADEYIEGLIKQVLDKLGDALTNRANKEGDDSDTPDYEAAERDLNAKRSEIISTFLEGFTQNYNARLRHIGSADSSAKTAGGQSSGLSLVDEKELEESLAVDGLVARARDRLRNELYALAQRFNVLIEHANYDEESQPYDPEVIGYAFRDVVQKMDLRVEIKLIAYKLFEQDVMQTLGQFYIQLNSLLSTAGVLPELKLSVPLRSVGGSPHAQHSEHKSEEHAGNGLQEMPQMGGDGKNNGHTSAPGDVYQTLQKLMNARKYGDVSPGGGVLDDVVDGGNGWDGTAGPSAGQTLPSEDLVKGLSLLQHEALPAMTGGAINIGVIKEALLGQMRQVGDGRGINPAHDNTIDVIGMIFEFILDEPSIPDIVKNLLNQLQIPILKIAIFDKEFFTNKNHAARRLLNVLGHASIGWNENDEESRQRRFQKMEYIVHRVLTEFEQDPGIFAALLTEFIEFLENDGEEAVEDVVVEEDIELSDQDQVVIPDRLTFETIEARLEGVEVPSILREFLRDVWRGVLQNALDHEGYESEAWRHSEQTLDDLIWSVEPKTTVDDRRKMVMLLPRLLDTLRKGMVEVGCSQQQIDELIDTLEPIHMACLHVEKRDAPAVPPDIHVDHISEPSHAEESNIVTTVQDDSLDFGERILTDNQMQTGGEMSDFEKELLGMDMSVDQEEPDHPDPEPVDIDDEFTAMAAEMSLGTWLEFDLGDKKRRGKLAWKSVVMGEYVFVDRKYKVVAERTLAGLAADLRNDTASLVENVPMFDRALDKVMNGLMSGNRTTH